MLISPDHCHCLASPSNGSADQRSAIFRWAADEKGSAFNTILPLQFQFGNAQTIATMF
jgi:hypothetical protein